MNFDLHPDLDIYQQKEDDVGALKTETQRLNKMRETIQRKLRSVEDQKTDTEQQRETLRGQINALERGINHHQDQLPIETIIITILTLLLIFFIK